MPGTSSGGRAKPGSDASARLVFAGSPEFAVPCLAALTESGRLIAAVLTQPDRPAGRGRRLRASPVKEYALACGIPVLQPRTLRDPAQQQRLRELRPELLVVVAYGLLLPPEVLAIPARGCINVHASLLPRWRGASPIQAALLAGDSKTGVSVMQMDAGLDTGPVFATRETEIWPTDTAATLHDRLAALGAGLLAELVGPILEGSAAASPQDDAAATYAARIDKSDARIDWRAAAADIDRMIRAYNPWPVADTDLDGQRMRCWAARVLPEADAADTPAAVPGAVVAVGADGIDVQTGDGILRLTEIQMPGRQRMPAGRFANGHAVAGKTLA